MDAAVADVIRFTVPGTPRGAQRARSRIVKARSGAQFVSTYTPAQTRAEQSAIRWFASAAMQGRTPFDGAVDLRISAFFQPPASWSQRKRAAALANEIKPIGRPDADNICKLVCDSMKGVIWRDDSQITEQHTWKRYSDEPRIVVEVRLAMPPG